MYDYILGANMIFNGLENKDFTQQSRLQRHTVNFSPFVYLNYAFSSNNHLSIIYSGGTSPPSATQLQPVPDNSNPLYIRLGNPDLKPTFIHSVSIEYNALKAATMRSLSASISSSIFNNKIINANWFDSLGRQVSQPQNVNGGYSLIANLVNAFPLKRLRTFINLNTRLIFRRDINIVNENCTFLRIVTTHSCDRRIIQHPINNHIIT